MSKLLTIISISLIFILFQNFSKVEIPSISEHKICVATQNNLISDPKYRQCVIAFGGMWLAASKNRTLEQFINATDEQILYGYNLNSRNGLLAWAKTHNIPFDTHKTFILDIEWAMHPSHMWKNQSYDENTIQGYVNAFNRRISIVKEYFPNAKISIYGIVTNHGAALNKNKVHKKIITNALNGLKKLAEYGFYEQIDYITPVMYIRWGRYHFIRNIKDPTATQKHNAIKKYRKYLRDWGTLSMEMALEVLDTAERESSKNHRPKILPLFTPLVANNKATYEMSHDVIPENDLLVLINHLERNYGDEIVEYPIWIRKSFNDYLQKYGKNLKPYFNNLYLRSNLFKSKNIKEESFGTYDRE